MPKRITPLSEVKVRTAKSRENSYTQMDEPTTEQRTLKNAER